MVTLCSVEVFGAIDVRIFGIIFEIMGELAMVEDSVVPKKIYIGKSNCVDLKMTIFFVFRKLQSA